MNKRIILFLSIAVLQLPLYGQWEVVNEGLKGRITEIDFVNENVGWIAGNNVLYSTLDEGETWHPLPLDENIDLEKIDFISENSGWALMDNKIFKSDNGGQNWYVQKTVPDTIYLETLYVVNDSIVFAAGNYSTVFKTTDGGLNWFNISPDSPDISMYSSVFLDSSIGVISGEYNEAGKTKSAIIKTFDGGQTWDVKIIPEFDGIYDLQFLYDSTCYFLASNNRNYFLCRTKDMFNSYIKMTQSSAKITSFFALDSSCVFALMDDSISYNVLNCVDGGFNWQKIKSDQYAILDKIYFSNKDKGFVLSANTCQMIWKSNDGGNTWIKNVNSYPFYGVTFVNNQTGFACGGYHMFHGIYAGDVFKTTDAGKSWTRKLHTFGSAHKTYFVNEQIGFSMDSGYRYSIESNIYKTVDGGNTWSIVYSNNEDSTGYNFNGGVDLNFINTNTGWVVGKASWGNNPDVGTAILETTDGGKSWNLVWNLPEDNMNDATLISVFSIDSTAWAVGSGGKVIKYTKQDQWQLQAKVTDLPLKDVFFRDKQHGWIAGGYSSDQILQSILLKTTDGGQTWNKINLDKYLINDLYFANSQHGWAVGEDKVGKNIWPYEGQGALLYTIDGGENWITIAEGLSGPLNSIFIKGNDGWAVGANGLVLRTENGLTWLNPNTGEKYPAKFSFSQNYPNPFNPKTTIEYKLPNIEHVELSIYNILGQKVSTLVNKKQPAGSYQVQWDASGFASGIYFYRLETDGGFIQVRKLVVLK